MTSQEEALHPISLSDRCGKKKEEKKRSIQLASELVLEQETPSYGFQCVTIPLHSKAMLRIHRYVSMHLSRASKFLFQRRCIYFELHVHYIMYILFILIV